MLRGDGRLGGERKATALSRHDVRSRYVRSVSRGLLRWGEGHLQNASAGTSRARLMLDTCLYWPVATPPAPSTPNTAQCQSRHPPLRAIHHTTPSSTQYMQATHRPDTRVAPALRASAGQRSSSGGERRSSQRARVRGPPAAALLPRARRQARPDLTLATFNRRPQHSSSRGEQPPPQGVQRLRPSVLEAWFSGIWAALAVRRQGSAPPPPSRTHATHALQPQPQPWARSRARPTLQHAWEPTASRDLPLTASSRTLGGNPSHGRRTIQTPAVLLWPLAT